MTHREDQRNHQARRLLLSATTVLLLQGVTLAQPGKKLAWPTAEVDSPPDVMVIDTSGTMMPWMLATQNPEPRDVRPHASSTFVDFSHSTGSFSLKHPADWKVHEVGTRTNVGTDDGLVRGARGFRTIYGVIVAAVDDPLAKSGKPRSLEASARAVVDAVLARNTHQSLHKPVYSDGMLGGEPAYSAEIMGISPVTGRGEWARIVCRRYGDSQIFHLILVSPSADRAGIEPVLERIRASVRVTNQSR